MMISLLFLAFILFLDVVVVAAGGLKVVGRLIRGRLEAEEATDGHGL
jgi:hypothetical protein